MARQSPNRPDADKPEPDLEIDEDLDEVDADEEEVEDDEETSPSASTRGASSLWSDTKIDPVEIALPSGVGYTLRAYRLSTALTPTDIADRDEEDPFAAKARHGIPEEDDETVVILDDDFPSEEDDEDDETEEIKRRGKHARDEDSDEPSAEDFEDEEEEEAAEEVPVFLSHRGRLLLFKSPESLVSFVRSGAPNDLAQVDGWAEVVERMQPTDVAPRTTTRTSWIWSWKTCAVDTTHGTSTC
ncbi:hypothetical protein Pflav_064100 [Phytohabitans flavus]|uniref:Uncharacterized protein n=1 Tax=Phytohabitans flavus TaxID=1076124 RepID=A0A6F8Y1R0_9ACTN|nr:hypothetical protein Pflav_064100 [Phytohabitans flavus]